MPEYLDPITGVITSAELPPGDGWELLPAQGTIIRTRQGDRWVAQRLPFPKTQQLAAEGWERVGWLTRPCPESYHTGARSGVRFGFAEPTKPEKLQHGTSAIAVVLPDFPGEQAPADCPGTRACFPREEIEKGLDPGKLHRRLLAFAPQTTGEDLARRLSQDLAETVARPSDR